MKSEPTQVCGMSPMNLSVPGSRHTTSAHWFHSAGRRSSKNSPAARARGPSSPGGGTCRRCATRTACRHPSPRRRRAVRRTGPSSARRSAGARPRAAAPARRRERGRWSSTWRRSRRAPRDPGTKSMPLAAMARPIEAWRSVRNSSRIRRSARARPSRPRTVAISAASFRPRSAKKSSQYECIGLAE